MHVACTWNDSKFCAPKTPQGEHGGIGWGCSWGQTAEGLKVHTGKLGFSGAGGSQGSFPAEITESELYFRRCLWGQARPS